MKALRAQGLPKTVVLGCPGLPSGRSTGPNVAVAHIDRPQCCCCTHQQALLCCCTTATALVWLPHTPVWLPHTPCVVSTQRQVCGCGSGAGPGGTRQSLEARGYTHAPKIASPRCGGKCATSGPRSVCPDFNVFFTFCVFLARWGVWGHAEVHSFHRIGSAPRKQFSITSDQKSNK